MTQTETKPQEQLSLPNYFRTYSAIVDAKFLMKALSNTQNDALGFDPELSSMLVHTWVEANRALTCQADNLEYTLRLRTKSLPLQKQPFLIRPLLAFAKASDFILFGDSNIHESDKSPLIDAAYNMRFSLKETFDKLEKLENQLKIGRIDSPMPPEHHHTHAHKIAQCRGII